MGNLVNFLGLVGLVWLRVFVEELAHEVDVFIFFEFELVLARVDVLVKSCVH